MSLYLFYPVFAAIFPAIFLCAKNVHEVKIKNLFLAITIAIFFLAAFFLISLYRLHNLDKSALVAFFAMIILYKTGHYYKKIIKKNVRERSISKILYTLCILSLTLSIGDVLGAINFDFQIANAPLFFFIYCSI